METEKIKSIGELREVLNEINIKIPDYPNKSIESKRLQESASILEDMIWDLINQDIKAYTNELSARNSNLANIAIELSAINKDLLEVSNKLKKASKIVGFLVKAALAAASAGKLK